jgi:hypothetical protein
MISEHQELISDARTVLDRAFSFEDYIIRRTLGLYFIAWATAFILYVLPAFAYSAMERFEWSYPLLYIGVTAIIVYFSVHLFRKAATASKVTAAFGNNGKLRYINIPILVVIFALIGITAIFRIYSYPLLLLYSVLAIYVPWVLLNVTKSTLAKVHPEIWIAVFTYFTSSIVSILAIIVFHDYLILSIVWIITAVVWFSCGISGIYLADYKSVVISDER